MKKSLLALMGLSLSFPLLAADVDLESVMKEMRKAYRQAEKADNVSEMQVAIDRLDQLVSKAKQGDYTDKRNGVYKEGFDKLSLVFDKIDAQLAQGHLEQAQMELDAVDSLKKQYHRKAKELR